MIDGMGDSVVRIDFYSEVEQKASLGKRRLATKDGGFTEWLPFLPEEEFFIGDTGQTWKVTSI